MHEDLIQLIEQAGVAFPHFGNGVSQGCIDQAEKSLGVPLPDSYKWWLLNYGIGQLNGDIVYGLDENKTGMADIVDLTGIYQQHGMRRPGQLVFCTGNEEDFFFDTSLLENGEYRVFCHDIGQNDSFQYANSFADFLRRRIRELHGIKS